jgi:hypothetical protein
MEIKYDDTNIFLHIFKNLPKILDDITYNILLHHLNKKKKLNVFKYYYNDCFLNTHKYNIIEKQFITSQKYYRAFSLLAYRYKYNNYKKNFIYDKDLMFNPLCEYKSNLIFFTIENKIPYKFLVNDILKIIRKSLLYNVEYFIESYKPRNPYTNIDLSYTFLINFYIFLKENNINISLIFELYYKSNFTISKFINEYQSIIVDEISKDYYMDYCEMELYLEIIYIIKHYKMNTNIYINHNYNKKLIINKFKPILIHHLNYCYSNGKLKQYKSKKFILNFLNNIEKNTPTFGFKTTEHDNALNSYINYNSHIGGVI